MSDPIVQMVQITLQIDGQETTVPAGTTVLKAAQQLGVSIPTLCHHPKLEDYGGCRLCLVEVESRGRTNYVVSCLYPVENGLSCARARRRWTRSGA